MVKVNLDIKIFLKLEEKENFTLIYTAHIYTVYHPKNQNSFISLKLRPIRII